MSPTSTDRITLTGSQHRELTRMTRAGRTEQRLVTRAKIVLAAAAGESNAQIARWLGICEDTVRKWRHRWCAAPGVASLADAKRSGRRPEFTAVQVARVKAMACTPPGTKGCRCRGGRARTWPNRRSPTGFASRYRRRPSAGGCPRTRSNRGSTSRGSSSPTPTSPPRRERVLDLYDPRLGRETIGPQRLCDLGGREDLHPGPLPLPPHPTARQVARDAGQPRLRPPRGGRLPGRLRRAPRESLRPLRGHHRHRRVRRPGRAGHDPGALRLADRVFWIVDNGSSHRGQAAIDRLAEQFPNAIMVHTPVHASWLNQVEIFFSIVQRKVLSPNDFTDTDEVSTGWPPSRPATTSRATVQVEVHHHRPGRPAGPGSTTTNPSPRTTPRNPVPHDPRRTYERAH